MSLEFRAEHGSRRRHTRGQEHVRWSAETRDRRSWMGSSGDERIETLGVVDKCPFLVHASQSGDCSKGISSGITRSRRTCEMQRTTAGGSDFPYVKMQQLELLCGFTCLMTWHLSIDDEDSWAHPSHCILHVSSSSMSFLITSSLTILFLRGPRPPTRLQSDWGCPRR